MGNVSAPGLVARSPSAMVSGKGIPMRWPARKESRVSLPCSGSTPKMRMSGRIAWAAMELPEISPPPPMGTTSASRSGISLSNSRAAVPWPAMVQG